MLIFAVDDEPEALQALHRAVASVAPQAVIRDYPLGTEALRAIEEEGLRPDAVFTDIRMPKLDGLALAERLKRLSPATKLVFVTAHTKYAIDAMYLHASGYILKPVRESRVREELEHAFPVHVPSADRLVIQCFGQFEVYWRGIPLMFRRRRTKELLALLVDRMGATCTAEEIAQTLWEGETDMRAMKHRIRDLISDLRKTLSGIGMEEVLVRRSGQVAIRRDLVDCDFFRMLDGDVQAANAFQGEYMRQYSWPEITTGRLYFRNL